MSRPLTRELLQAATKRLQAAGVASPAADARRLMTEAMENVPADPDKPAPIGGARRFEAMISQRETRLPVSRILGYRDFYKHRFFVGGDVLDPRPETETLIEQALCEPFTRVLDLGTGSGCILLSLLLEVPTATGLGTDISTDALDIAEDNPILMDNQLIFDLDARVKFLESDWFSAVDDTFDLIVSNPPYITADEMAGLSPEVRDYEPHIALTPGGDGLDAYRAITAEVQNHLTPGGRLLVEIGPTQGAAVHALFQTAGLIEIKILPDLDGRDRVVEGRKPPKT